VTLTVELDLDSLYTLVFVRIYVLTFAFVTVILFVARKICESWHRSTKGSATVWSTRDRKDAVCTCCRQSHRCLLHSCYWFWTGAEIRGRGLLLVSCAPHYNYSLRQFWWQIVIFSLFSGVTIESMLNVMSF